MRVVLRADAGPARGTGHVMRCLTVGEALRARGHEVELAGNIREVPWLEARIAAMALPVHEVPTDSMDTELFARLDADRVVVDSYWIDPAAIGRVNATRPVLAIIDHDARGIDARWLLDQNLGAEDREGTNQPDTGGTDPCVLRGSRWALVRSAIVAERRGEGWRLPPRPRVVAFMGGTDPFEVMTGVARSIASASPDLDLTAVTTEAQLPAVAAALTTMPNASAVPPTPDLPTMLGGADVIVSAAGTSAWDVLTLGRPSVLVGVVENQRAGLTAALERGMTLGVDATRGDVDAVGGLLARLLGDEALRRRLLLTAAAEFDGAGAARVAHVLEQG